VTSAICRCTWYNVQYNCTQSLITTAVWVPGLMFFWTPDRRPNKRRSWGSCWWRCRCGRTCRTPGWRFPPRIPGPAAAHTTRGITALIDRLIFPPFWKPCFFLTHFRREIANKTASVYLQIILGWTRGFLHGLDHEGIIYYLCPFAVYYLRYAVTSFSTISRISLADGKRAGQKVHRKSAIAVQNVKPVLGSDTQKCIV
jgi:hypothetical protein